MTDKSTHSEVLHPGYEHLDVFELYYAAGSSHIIYGSPPLDNDTRSGWEFRCNCESLHDALQIAKEEGRRNRWEASVSPTVIRPRTTDFFVRRVNAVRAGRNGKDVMKLSQPIKFWKPGIITTVAG